MGAQRACARGCSTPRVRGVGGCGRGAPAAHAPPPPPSLARAGTALGVASAPYATSFPHPSWAEQNPADWWEALGKATRGAVAAAGVSPDDIAAVCGARGWGGG